MQPQEKEMRVLDQRDLDENPELAEQGLKVGDEVELSDEDDNDLEARRTGLNYVYYENTPGELVASVNGVPTPGGGVPLLSLATSHATLFKLDTNTASATVLVTNGTTTTPPTVMMNSGLSAFVKSFGNGRPPVK